MQILSLRIHHQDIIVTRGESVKLQVVRHSELLCGGCDLDYQYVDIFITVGELNESSGIWVLPISNTKRAA